MKNKKLLLLIVLAVLVAGSMVVEATIGDRIKTLTDGINLKGFAPIIVNTIILTVIIYFVLQLLGFKGGESNTSKVVVLLMIIIIAFIISKKTVVDDNGNNVYIWSAKGFVKGFLDIIKNPNSLYVFVGATLIFLWLFTFLKVGGDGFGSKLNVVMAILIGYSLATAKSPDLSKVVKMGEIVAIYIIYHNLKQSIKNEYAAIGGAAFLVFYISSVSFPDKGLISTIPGLILNTLFIVGQIVLIALIGFGSNLIGNRFEGKAAKLFSKLGSFVVGIVIVYGLSYLFNLIPYVAENAGMGIFTGKSWKTLFGVVAGIAVIIAVMAGMGKKDEEKKEKDKKARWKQDGISYGYHLFLNWAGRTKNPLVRFLYRLIDPKESAPSDQLHFGFRALRVEFMTMMNYLLRLQIFFSKRETMTAKLNKFNKKIYGTEGGLNYVPEIEKVMSNLILLKTGVDFIKGDDGKWKPGKGVEVIGDDNKASKVYAGFAQHEYLIYSLLNKLKENIESCKFADQSLQVQEQIKEDIAAELEPAMAGLESSKKKFGFNPDEPTSRAGYLERIGAYRTVEMWRIIILDWYRKHGRNNHTYLFAKDGAEIYEVPISTVPSDNGLLYKCIKGSAGGITPTGEVKGQYSVEVDSYGYFIEDLNNYILNGGSGTVRKVEPTQIEHHKMLNIITKWLETEWAFFVDDMRVGKFHKNSRSSRDYNLRHSRRSFNYEGLTPAFGDIGEKHPAFDRQALLNPTFEYIGRHNHNSDKASDIPTSGFTLAKMPGLSTVGMRDYIVDYLKTKTKQDQQFWQQLSMFSYDSGAGKGDIFTNQPHETEGKEKAE